MATYYAWSDLYNGGKVQEVKRANGAMAKIVTDRNIIKRGEKVTKAQLKVSDEEWDHLVESGSIRSYKLPDGTTDRVSPTRALILSLLDRRGEVDMNKLLEMGLANAPVVEEEDEEATAPAGV